MKRLLSVAGLLMILISLQSCQKEHNCLPKAYPIVGLWIGTYKVTDGGKDTGTDNLYYSYDIRQDSTILTQGLGADGNTYYAVGTWSLKGNTFTATYITQNFNQAGAVQDATGIYDEKKGTLTGTYLTEGNSFKAAFSLNRIN